MPDQKIDYSAFTTGYWKEMRKEVLHNLETCDKLIRLGEISRSSVAELVVRRAKMVVMIQEIDDYLKSKGV